MFIRRTKTRTTANGISYYSYRLVDTYRVADKVRQRTLLNLGSTFDCPREQWPELTGRIEEIIQGLTALFEPSPTIESLAQSLAATLLHKYAQTNDLFKPGAASGTGGSRNTESEKTSPTADNTAPNIPTDTRDLHTVDLDSLALMDVRTVGAEALALSAIEQTHLPEKLTALGFNRNQLSAVLGNLVGRMIQPGSELSTFDWLQTHSALGELLGCHYESMSLSSLYRASDQLWQQHDKIEAFLYQQHQTLFGFGNTITLYDLTNTFFEGTGQLNTHAAYGHSKEKRSDCPLVTLALVLDGSGFSRKSRIFAGNVGEAKTLQEMIEALADTDPVVQGRQSEIPWEQRPTVVMDAGIATKENVDWLVAQGYPYIVVSRQRHQEFDATKAVVVKEHQHDQVCAQRVEVNPGEVALYCHSRRREKKERAIVDRFSGRFEQELEHLEAGLHQPRRMKKTAKIQQKIGRLRQKYSRISGQYEITLESDEKTRNVTALHWKKQIKEDHPDSHPGVYCLRTNQTQWSEERIWNTYIMLTDLEAVFRSLKSELGMRPVYHQKTARVEGHIWITLLAYNLVHHLRRKLKEKGIDDSWETLRTTMSTQTRTTVTLTGQNGEQIHIRKSSYPKSCQQRILRALQLKLLPGKTEKTIIESQKTQTVVP